jgi:hypothetical protein
LSLTLFYRGGVDLTVGFCLRTLSYSRLTAIVGPILDTIVVSCVVLGLSWEKLGRHINMGLLHPFTVSSVVTPRGYKADGGPSTDLRPFAWTLVAPSWWGHMGYNLSYGWMNVTDGFVYLNGQKLEVLLLLQPRLTTLIQVFNRGKRFKLRHVHCAKAQLTEVQMVSWNHRICIKLETQLFSSRISHKSSLEDKVMLDGEHVHTITQGQSWKRLASCIQAEAPKQFCASECSMSPNLSHLH